MSSDKPFTFEISLSVLNHLGRNLYRSFMTVLGEAISNSWDANAENVWIYIDRDKGSMFIKDDGDGMTYDDFQDKFLKIGYSKRKDGTTKSVGKERPFIGRKGIGKLALLSCANKITIISKTLDTDYVGGTIDNSGLDKAIESDMKPSEYPLLDWDKSIFERLMNAHKKGTVIYFDHFNEGIRNTLNHLGRSIALYFRFSLLDPTFNIYLNDEKITIEHLRALVEKTQFLWKLNDPKDPYCDELSKYVRETVNLAIDGDISGFIASVKKPLDLKVLSTEEKVGVDLFVNGRLREKDILEHIPTARIVESYLYGQIHYNGLDDETDRFASAREGMKADDPKYAMFLALLSKRMQTILNDWDILRIKYKDDGDPENKRIPIKERRAGELYNEVSKDYSLPVGTMNKKKVDEWIDEISPDAAFNMTSYTECYLSENLIRKHIVENKIELTLEAKLAAERWQTREAESKSKGGISINLRESASPLTYLSMDDLANMVDKPKDPSIASLSRDAKEYKPMRDAVAHTARLTAVAKNKLTSVYENIKGRVMTLLTSSKAA